MAFKLSFNRVPKHRTFSFTPRYWNPEKEELQTRIRDAEREAGYSREEDGDKPYMPNIKGQFRRNLSQASRSDGGIKKIRYVIMLVTLFIIFVALWKMSDIFNFLFEALYNK